MSSMFYINSNLKTIKGLSNWDTSKVDNMNNMFAYSNKLESIANLSEWNTINLTKVEAMVMPTPLIIGI